MEKHSESLARLSGKEHCNQLVMSAIDIGGENGSSMQETGDIKITNIYSSGADSQNN